MVGGMATSSISAMFSMRMRLHDLVTCQTILAAVFVCSMASAADAPHTAKKMNVVLILADDFGWTDLACYGSKLYESPNIDKLAHDGMKFTQNYSACTVCSPTRAALLTGKYPARLHITHCTPAETQD